MSQVGKLPPAVSTAIPQQQPQIMSSAPSSLPMRMQPQIQQPPVVRQQMLPAGLQPHPPTTKSFMPVAPPPVSVAAAPRPIINRPGKHYNQAIKGI